VKKSNFFTLLITLIPISVFCEQVCDPYVHEVITNNDEIFASLKILSESQISDLVGNFKSFDTTCKKHFAFELLVENNSSKTVSLNEKNLFSTANQGLKIENILANYDSIAKFQKIKWRTIAGTSTLAGLIPTSALLIHLISIPLFSKIFGKYWKFGLIPLGIFTTIGWACTGGIAIYSILTLRSTISYIDEKKDIFKQKNVYPEESFELTIPAKSSAKIIFFVSRKNLYPDMLEDPVPNLLITLKSITS